jgi:hypothetical protein
MNVHQQILLAVLSGLLLFRMLESAAADGTRPSWKLGG